MPAAASRRPLPPHLRVPPDETLLGVAFVDGPADPVPMGIDLSAMVRLVYPAVSYAALLPGASIEVVEGGRVVARGQVTQRC